MTYSFEELTEKIIQRLSTDADGSPYKGSSSHERLAQKIRNQKLGIGKEVNDLLAQKTLNQKLGIGNEVNDLLAEKTLNQKL